MNAFMYYIRRIDLLAVFAARDKCEDDFISFAMNELDDEITQAANYGVISDYQLKKLTEKFRRTFP